MKVLGTSTGSLARITETKADKVIYAECSCGWIDHGRKKPLYARIDRHVDKQHGGRAIYL